MARLEMPQSPLYRLTSRHTNPPPFKVQAELRREGSAAAALTDRAAAAGREVDKAHADAMRLRDEAAALAARVQVGEGGGEVVW